MERPVAVVGCGALGGLLAASLLRARVSLVLAGRDSARLALIRRRGLRVVGPAGNWRARGDVRIFSGRPPAGGCAAVFLCVKSYDLRAALPTARLLAKGGAPVVSLLNGFTHAGPLRRAFGSRLVLGAAYLAAMRTGPNEVRHAGGNKIWLGRGPGNRAAVKTGKDLLLRAQWRVSVAAAPDILWSKAVMNAAVNPVGALTLTTNDRLAADPALREIVLRAAGEVVAVARAAGRLPLAPGRARRVVAGCADAPGQLNSMASDLRAGRRTEARDLLGPILAAAGRSGTPAPILAGLYRFVRGLEVALHAR